MSIMVNGQGTSEPGLPPITCVSNTSPSFPEASNVKVSFRRACIAEFGSAFRRDRWLGSGPNLVFTVRSVPSDEFWGTPDVPETCPIVPSFVEVSQRDDLLGLSVAFGWSHNAQPVRLSNRSGESSAEYASATECTLQIALLASVVNRRR